MGVLCLPQQYGHYNLEEDIYKNTWDFDEVMLYKKKVEEKKLTPKLMSGFVLKCMYPIDQGKSLSSQQKQAGLATRKIDAENKGIPKGDDITQKQKGNPMDSLHNTKWDMQGNVIPQI